MTELCLPKLIMPEGQKSEVIPLTTAEIREVMGIKLPKVVDEYVAMLSEGGSYYRRVELARRSEEDLAEHIQQLGELKAFLEAFGINPSSFDTREHKVSLDDNSYTARLKRAQDPPIGEGPENAQTQISFFAQLTESGETKEAAILGASVKGVAPAIALRRADREIRGGRVTVNTIQLYYPNDSSRLRIAPQAGISIVRVGEDVDIDGVTFKGKIIHNAHVPNEDLISIKDYHVARELTMRLAGVGQ